jgi:predicted Zn-dependent protease
MNGGPALGLACCLALTSLAAPGCEFGPPQGPGHRRQALALTPKQELNLGQQAYQKVLEKYHPVTGRDADRVEHVGRAIVEAAKIPPLQREIGLRPDSYPPDDAWEFKLLESEQVNAFCLPGGKVAVFTGLMKVVQDSDAQLAAVLGHEIAHALAHHASERIARQEMYQKAIDSLNGALGQLSPEDQRRLIGLLGAGAALGGLAYDRQQESEADHIGVFLMAFARYDPDEAVRFWEKMEALSRDQGRPPTILSDHPSDAQRIRQLRRWSATAKEALLAWKMGRIAPEAK